MTRVYMLPKIFILSFIMIMFYRPLTWYTILIMFIISALVVFLYHVLDLVVRGKYYLYLQRRGKVSKEKIYSAVHRYMSLANRILRMDLFVEHYERFDPKKHYLIIPNHQSNADATVMMETFKSPIAFVSKASMSRVIIVKDWMNLMGCLYLDKDDMRGQVKVMTDVANSLNKGNSIIIFPEGKRSFSAEMNEFRSGTFKMATKTQSAILPVTINNVYKMRHRLPFRTTNINIYIHEPIPYEDYKDLSTQEIADKVKNIIASKIERE